MRPTHYATRTKYDLTRRQRDVLDLIAKGRTNPQIAEALGISLDGAKFHVSEILAKLELSSREEAAEWWERERSVGTRLRRLSIVAWFAGAPRIAAAMAAGGVAGAGAIAAVLLFIISGGPGSPTVPPSPTPPMTATADATTGIAALDATLAVLRSGDIDRVMHLVQFTQMGCQPESSDIVCPLGTAAGTKIPAFPISKCEGGFAGDLADARPPIEQALAAGTTVYAVATVQSADQRWVGAAPAANGWVVITSESRRGDISGAMWFVRNDGRVVSLVLGCGAASAPNMLVSSNLPTPDWIIPPAQPAADVTPPMTDPVAILQRSDQAMTTVPFVREERLYTGGHGYQSDAGQVLVFEYEGDRSRSDTNLGRECDWFTGTTAAFSHRASGGEIPDALPGGTRPDGFSLRLEMYDGNAVYVVSYHFKTPSTEGPFDMWETDWIDRDTYHLLRYEQDDNDPWGSQAHLSAVLLYPPDGPLRECPSKPSVDPATLQPLALHHS